MRRFSCAFEPEPLAYACACAFPLGNAHAHAYARGEGEEGAAKPPITKKEWAIILEIPDERASVASTVDEGLAGLWPVIRLS